MKRLHVLLRLFVLAAMTLSIAEGVWVSICLPMETMAAMESMAMSDAPASDAMPDMPDMPAGDRQQGEQDPPCPLGAAAVAQGCATASSLPATSSAPFVATAERALRMSVVQVPDDLIDGSTPFHPPRA